MHCSKRFKKQMLLGVVHNNIIGKVEYTIGKVEYSHQPTHVHMCAYAVSTLWLFPDELNLSQWYLCIPYTCNGVMDGELQQVSVISAVSSKLMSIDWHF